MRAMFDPAATPWSCQKPRSVASVEVKDSSANPFRNSLPDALAAGIAARATVTAIAATTLLPRTLDRFTRPPYLTL